jgi:hypothetical protein
MKKQKSGLRIQESEVGACDKVTDISFATLPKEPRLPEQLLRVLTFEF